MHPRRLKILCTFGLVVSTLCLWEIGARLTSPIFIPKPDKVIKAFVEVVINGQLEIAFLYSFVRITIASVLSALLSITIGCLMKTFCTIRFALNPAIKVMRFLPVTAFYPMLTIWFGIGEEMKIAFLFIATFVYMLPSVLMAMDDVDKTIIEAASVEGAGKIGLVHKIILPISAPSISQSFAMMYGIGYTYIAVAEQTNAKYGLGYLIYTSSARGLTYMTFVGIVAIIITSIVFDLISALVIKKIFSWKFS